MKYRIMVEEKNSGEMGYTPQVKFSWWSSWENILTDSQTRISTSDTARQYFIHKKMPKMQSPFTNKHTKKR